MYLLKNELKKKTFGSCPFIDQSYFNYDGAQLYQIFQPIYKTITTFSDIPNIISEWKLRGHQIKNLDLLVQQIKFFLQYCNEINLK